jgi:eukaryotic-like serine/threonine-protein kinase
MWQPNQTIENDRFLIQEVLGGGGFGVAYRAFDRKNNQLVVIKTLNQRQQNQADFEQQQKKFVNEAMTLKGLKHPHIVKVYELIQEGGLWGMVMEYLDGQELAAYVEQRKQLTEQQALDYIEQVGKALVYVHEEGILHRDIKPHNIMLRAGNREAVLIDFGLARGFIDGRTLSMTNSHTHGYAPIEQYDRHGHFGAYTDVYALAATLYHLVTGEAPTFNSKGRWEAQEKGQSINHFLWDKIPQGVSEQTKQGIVWGMAVLPQDRPETMGKFLQLLGVGAQPVPLISNPRVTPVTPPVQPSPSPTPVVKPAAQVKKPVQPKSPIQPQIPVKLPAQVKKPSSDLANRRNFLKWLGFGGVGAVSVLALSQIGKNSPSDNPVATSNSPKNDTLPLDAYNARVIWRDELSLKKEPTASAEKVGKVSFNEQVAVIKESDDRQWLLIRSKISNTEGWVKAGNIDRDGASPDLKELKLTKIQFTSVNLNNKGNVISKPAGSAEIFTDALGNGVGLTMVRIPTAKFLMGSPKSEKDRHKGESPQHQVNISEFYLGQTLVTQAQWQAIMGNNPAHFQGNNKLPVEQVSWLDAVDFCEKLSQKTGRTYRLPSEAEWEYACRSGNSTPYAFREMITPEVVNYNGNYPYGRAAKGEYRERTTPVGYFPPNLFGLYDMHGNVLEWCLDEWFDNHNGAPIDGSARGDISSRDKNKQRLLRGGSWIDNASLCRSASRVYSAASEHVSFIGFRVVCLPSRTF